MRQAHLRWHQRGGLVGSRLAATALVLVAAGDAAEALRAAATDALGALPTDPRRRRGHDAVVATCLWEPHPAGGGSPAETALEHLPAAPHTGLQNLGDRLSEVSSAGS